MFRNQAIVAKVTLLHFEPKIWQRVEPSFIGSSNFPEPGSRHPIIYNGNVVVITEHADDEIQIQRVFAADVILNNG
jgi:hypothetical protein